MAEDTDVEAAAEPGAEPTMAASTGSVARARFTSAVDNREPVDDLSRVENDIRTVYFFTELMDMDGQTVIHRWRYDGNVMAEVDFAVGGPRWRVSSSKNLLPEWTGTWEVDVLNANGEVVETRSFDYVEAPAAPAPAESTPVEDAASDQPVTEESTDSAPAEAAPAAGEGQ
ncbi:MAG: DUF2914 domain-containing protein [Chromatiales bacterium]|nr:DUF2914 domain-containing protein [Chromatiales bacterium]